MESFFLPLWIVFIAEMGDKTQLVALCLATRFKARVVLGGIFAATLVVHIISVVLGKGLEKIVPPSYIALLAGLAFIGFGLWTLRGDELSDDECQNIQGRSPFWLVFTTFFLAELGDKTMLSTVSLATVPGYSAVMVWLGSSLGMVISDGLAILVGKAMGAKLPERAIKIGASFIFFGFGIYKISTGATNLPALAWAGAAIVTAVMLAVFFRGMLAARNEAEMVGLEKEALATASMNDK